jgi:hypothetical protein
MAAMTREVFVIVSLAAPVALAQSIDATARTIATSSFVVAWNTGADTEAITALKWKGGSNTTGTLGVDACSGAGLPGNVEYFGNSSRRRILNRVD